MLSEHPLGGAPLGGTSGTSETPIVFETTVDTLRFSEVIDNTAIIPGVIATSDILKCSDVISSQEMVVTEVVSDLIIIGENMADEQNLSDVIFVSDSVVVLEAADNNDALFINEAVDSHLEISTLMSDSLLFKDELFDIHYFDFIDTLVFLEYLSPIEYYIQLVDNVFIADFVEYNIEISTTLGDISIVSDQLNGFYKAIISDSLSALDATDSITLIASPSLFDVLQIIDDTSGAITIYAPNLTDTLLCSEEYDSASNLTLVAVLSDTMLVGDTLSDTTNRQKLAVVNAETGAVSTYELSVIVAGLAEYNGVLYLVGPKGLYALDATADENGDVIWTMRTGFSNLGTEFIKRVPDINIQGRTEKEIIFKTVSNRNGDKEEYHYQMKKLDRSSYRDGVIHAGKGIHSVYWQFALSGTGPAEIDQLKIAIEPLSKRR